MREKSKLRLSGLIIVIIVIVFWLLIILPVLKKFKRIAQRAVCGTQLYSIGGAMAIYAEDYDGYFPILPGKGPWSKRLGFDYDNLAPDFNENGAEGNVSRTISASLYLLVRNVDVDPNHFVCPWAEQTDFKKSFPKKYNLTELWDFGPDPYKHVSYSYHNPYGKFPADNSRRAPFAVIADMNPWFKNGDIIPPGENNKPPQILDFPPELLGVKYWETDDMSLRQKIQDILKLSNSLNNLAYTGPLEKKAIYSEGQNVLWNDGHSSFEKQANTGVKYDNIYTFWSTEENPTEQDKQGGTAPTSRSPENNAKSKDDSFLAI